MRITHGAATVTEGADEGDERDATITGEGHDYLRLASGHLNHVSGVLTCQLKVKGDTAKALPFSSVINFPKARQALSKGRLSAGCRRPDS